MRLVITRFRNVEGPWFVSEKDETLSRLCEQPLIDTSSDLLTSWPTRGQACTYAAIVARLVAGFPNKPLKDIRERAQGLASHG